MSIEESQDILPSVTEGNRALELFTDRYGFIRQFAECLNVDPAPKTIFFWYGAGGNGKSLLLKYLRQKCCKRLLPGKWNDIKHQSDFKIASYIEQVPASDCNIIPSVLLDFDAKPLGNEQPQDRFYGLLTLRRNLAESASPEYIFRFPLFDFACVWYLHKKGKSAEEIKALFPLNEVTGLISPLLDLVTENPVGSIGKAILDLLGRDWGSKLTVYLTRLGISKQDFDSICSQDLDTELIDGLPRLLGRDLNAIMVQPDAPQRIVLFLDTHEAFWGNQTNLPNQTYFFKDEWLRRLLRVLELKAGIVVIIAGRDQPRWPEAKTVKLNTDIPLEFIQRSEVGNFTVADAEAYLIKVGVLDASLRNAFVRYASVNPTVEPAEIHPLFLGLTADIFLQAQAKAIVLQAEDFHLVSENRTDQAKFLIERLLKYVNSDIRYAIHALSACRAFNFNLYRQIGESLAFGTTRADFDLITGFSFTMQSRKNNQDWYRLHDLLRRLDDETENEQTTAAHQFLESYYRANGELAEAIFHANRLDWQRGVQEWIQQFDQALQFSKYNDCSTLLEVRRELGIANYFDLGSISLSEGNYFAQLSRHDEAKQEYLEAIASYDGALKLAPDYINALNNKGTALQSLADLQSGLSQHPAALENYAAAIASYDGALKLAPDYIQILNNKGNALSKLAFLQSGLSQHSVALDSYGSAIASYDAALKLAPNYIDALNNKGLALQSLADLQSGLSQHPAALENYAAAIASYDGALKLAPDDIYALNNKGNALQRLADLQSGLSQHPAALENYAAAIASYDGALKLAPDYIQILNNKGNALSKLAFLQSGLSQHSVALDSYGSAIASYDAALKLAPNYIDALNNKGLALKRLADLQFGLSQHPPALEGYQIALDLFCRVLQLAPNNELANNRRKQLQTLLEILTIDPTDQQ